MASTYHFIVAIPEQEPISYAIKDESVSIGRSPENDIQVLVREVSTRHCELVGDEDGYEIVDLGSSNGTRVKGQGIRNGRVFLNHRDKIILGETVPAYFVVVEEGEKFSVRKTIAEIEENEQAKAPEESSEEAPVVPEPAPVPATHATQAQAGSSTQVLKKKPKLPSRGGGAALPPVKKVPSLSKPGAEKPKLPTLSKPGASTAGEPEPEKPKVPALKKPGASAAPVAAAEPLPVEVVEEPGGSEEKPKVPALKKPVPVEPVEEAAPAKAKVPALRKPGASGTPAVPVLSKPGGVAKKVPSLSKPGASSESATGKDEPAAKKVPKLNIPRK